VRAVADALAAPALAALNYSLILLDDCWSATNRSAAGELQPDAARFPSGMPALAAYVKARGLALGLYTCAGTKTCKYGRPGSAGNYARDAATLVGWGVEYIKADNCNTGGLGAPRDYFGAFSAAINATGVPVAFAACEWGLDDVAAWGPNVSQVYRVRPDHLPFWSFDLPNAYPPGGQGTGDIIEGMANASVTAGLAPFSYPDPDFLMTGLFQTEAETVTEFSFWSLWSAPLIVATDVRNMSQFKVSVLTNADVLAVQADAALAPAARLRAGAAQLWAKPLAGGDVAVVLFNADGAAARDVPLAFADIGGAWAAAGAEVRVYDLWAHAVIAPAATGGLVASALPPHGSKMWRLSLVAAAGGRASPTAIIASDPLVLRAGPTAVAASDPLVLWAGRPSFEADGSVAFDWLDTSCTFVVAGVGASVTLLTNFSLPAWGAGFHGARVSVFVNDMAAADLMLSPSTHSYLLAAALPQALNTVTVHYAFEQTYSFADRAARQTFSIAGFAAGDGGAFAPPTPLARRIDVVGDSITAGAMYDRLEAVRGDLSLGTGCAPWSPPQGMSSAYTWQSYLSRALRANTTTVAWSGKGLIHNGACHAGPTMPQLWRQAFASGDGVTELYDFSRAARPDAVIVYLGTNDFSCALTTTAAFSDGLLSFWRNITADYAASPGPARTTFFAAVGPMSPTAPRAGALDAVARANAAGMAAFFIDMAGNATVPVALDGCGGHPGPFGHWTMATLAVPQVRAAMGW